MSATIVTLVLAACTTVVDPPEDKGDSDSAGKRRVVEYAPGLRIDWEARHVEIDGAICLREGALELFACSAHTREHESVVVVKPRPLRIYEALGLIGLEPGHPVSYDAARDRWLPPDGDRMTLAVRWTADGTTHTSDIGQWMIDVKTERPPPVRQWAFAGSTREGKVFGADVEGTIICVVDFPTGLIALPEQYSSDNDSLWLRANTDAIPPLKTPVTLVVTPLQRRDWTLRLGSGGKLTLDGARVAADTIATRLDLSHRDDAYAYVHVIADERASDADIDAAAKSLRSVLHENVRLTIERQRPAPKVDPTSPNGDSDGP